MIMTDFLKVRQDFPILSASVHGYPLIYLDNAATTQLPQCVGTVLQNFYRSSNANVHRGIHHLSEQATIQYEAARAAVRRFLDAASDREVVFTSGTTAAINLVARGFQECVLHAGDEVIVSEMEHHSNFLPWREACEKTGAILRVIALTETGDLDLECFFSLLSPKTKMVAVTAVSNVLGTVNPLPTIIQAAHHAGAAVLVDAAQAVRHFPMQVQTLDCDFLCFSGHKIMGPAGIGVLYGKQSWLENLPPVFFGGGMVERVSRTHVEYAEIPHKLEAGTPNYPGAIGLAAALDYLSNLGFEQIARQEAALLQAYETMLQQFPSIHILGSPKRRVGAISFTASNLNPYDIATLLDQLGIAVRSGHHCAQPLLHSLGISYALRISPAFYNCMDEIPCVQTALDRVLSVLGGLS
ncbi:MAG: SufS family cysteine desulfurase [Oscillospiraceae bacterium]|nr:SufS family cysteine desulfurase [Oscillospiraceae bacterium]